MSTEYFQNKFRVNPARASWHHYAGGAYFITVCTKNMEYFLGDVVETGRAPSLREMVCTTGQSETGRAPSLRLTPIGQFLHDSLRNATIHYPYTEIPLFVVMPNHWHAIVLIDEKKTPYPRRNIDPCDNVKMLRVGNVEMGRAPSLRETMQNIDNKKGWLSVVIGGLKSATTKFARINGYKDFAWQTRFHDHIIRNQREMNRIANYIENNPLNWSIT